MKHTGFPIAPCLLAVVLCGPIASAGQSSPMVQVSPEGIGYATGGVGEEEREELRTLAPDYSLRLRFAEKVTGLYLAGVSVLIQSLKGAAAMTASDVGPTLLVSLPPGSYRVTASREGMSRSVVLTVPPKGGVEQVLYW